MMPTGYGWKGDEGFKDNFWYDGWLMMTHMYISIS